MDSVTHSNLRQIYKVDIQTPNFTLIIINDIENFYSPRIVAIQTVRSQLEEKEQTKTYELNSTNS